MRILLVSSSAYPAIGGVENSLKFMARELLRVGHEVMIVCLQSSSEHALQTTHEGVEILRLPHSSKRWPHSRLYNSVKTVKLAMPKIIQKFKPDAVWSRSLPMGIGIRQSGFDGPLLQIFATNAKMNCKGLYLKTHGLPWERRLMLLGLWPFDYFPSAKMERELVENSVAVAFSENMSSQLSQACAPNSSVCTVIRPGVDEAVFSPENGSQYFDVLAREYDLHPGDPVVLYVGRLANAKRIPMLLDAFSLLKTKAKLVLVGGGPDEKYLRNYASQIGVGNRVVFAGTQSKMLPGFYSFARVLALPTTIESFGQVYLESLASGTPAVGFAGDGKSVFTATSEIIRNGKTGLSLEKVGPQALADGLDAILSLDESSYKTMSNAARKDVIKRFSWQNFVEQALSLSGPEYEGSTHEV